VNYALSTTIGDEIQGFVCDDDGNIIVAGFKRPGVAQAAGVRVGWRIDVGRTFGAENPGKRPTIDAEAILSSMPACADFMQMSDVTLVFERPETDSGAGDTMERSGSADHGWESAALPGDSAEFIFATDGDGSDSKERRWGFFALILSADAGEPPSKEAIDKLVAGYQDATQLAKGITKDPCLEKVGWDEGRLRALCQRHGWDFEWMTEGGERHRRRRERQGCVTKTQMKMQKRPREGEKPDGFTVR